MTDADFAADHYLAVARGYAAAAAWGRAADVCRRAVAVHPADARLWEQFGMAAWAADDWPTAAWALETAELYAPVRPVVRLALADAYLGLGRAADAVPGLRFLAEPGRCDLALLPHVAGRLFRAGAYRPAAKVWRRVCRQQPEWAEAHYRYALCLWAADAPPESLFEPLNEAVQLTPDEPRYALALAGAWIECGCTADAAAVLDALPPDAVSCPGCLTRMAAVYARADRPADAAACLRRRAAVPPTP